ncbi:MAG: hypothetical protein U9N73_04065 [Candidatus Auribacterota bacterium]|nr:hypothetical protein [Candidatus Auribacterota bacterium]
MNKTSYIKNSDFPAYASGDTIRIGGKDFRIVTIAGKGRRSIVYQVENQDGLRFALKIPINKEPKTLNSLRKEKEKGRAYARYGFRHAGIICSGENYILKNWVEGLRGDRWTRQWAEEGFSPHDPRIINLIELLRYSAEKKIYLRDLNQNNLIWDGESWVIIDTGSIKKRFSRSRILRLYREYISENWGRSTTPNCGEVFRRLLP